MAVLLFYLFKELKFRSQFVNKAAAYVFAVFALNNSLVTILMEWIEKNGFVSPNGFPGFLVLAGVVLGAYVCCLLVGVIREILFRRIDRKIGAKAQMLFAFLQHE